jgi:hypothetical protein
VDGLALRLTPNTPRVGFLPEWWSGAHRANTLERSDVTVATGEVRVPTPAKGVPTLGPAPPGGPVSRRVEGVDVARGVALIGIVVVNVLPDSPTGELLLVWTVLAGRVAALFALIAGISIALQSGGRQPPAGRAMTAARGALALRAVLITGIGLLLGSTDTTVAIILPYYGILFLLAVPLLGLGRRTLLVLTVVFAVAGPVAMQLVRAGWPEMPVFDGEYTFGLAAAHPGVFLTASARPVRFLSAWRLCRLTSPAASCGSWPPTSKPGRLLVKAWEVVPCDGSRGHPRRGDSARGLVHLGSVLAARCPDGVFNARDAVRRRPPVWGPRSPGSLPSRARGPHVPLPVRDGARLDRQSPGRLDSTLEGSAARSRDRPPGPTLCGPPLNVDTPRGTEIRAVPSTGHRLVPVPTLTL